MLTGADLIKLAYTPELTHAGITYACRSLPYTYDRMGGTKLDRLRRIVAGKAVELAFRRHLVDRAVPFDNLGATPFTDPDHYDVALGGRRCDIKSFLLHDKDLIRQVRRSPDLLLDAAALVPRDQLTSRQRNNGDLFIFAFVTALITQDSAQLQRAISRDQPVYLIHPFQPRWSHPAKWRSFGTLLVQSEPGQALVLEAGGQIQDGSFQTEQIELKPNGRASVQTDFHSLAYLHAARLPDHPLTIYSSMSREVYSIAPKDWGNIWIYGMEIFLAGYMSLGEFSRQAELLPAGSQVLQYPRTRIINYALPAGALRSMQDLYDRAGRWEQAMWEDLQG